MNKLIITIVALLIISGGAFYGGMKYGQAKSNFSRQNFQNLSEAERQQLFQRGVGMRQGAGFLSGEVITKDEQNLTLKMPDGSSKIIFFSQSTEVSKMAEGTIDDVEVGKQVMVSGSQNSDGSYTAKTIQLSPPRQAAR